MKSFGKEIQQAKILTSRTDGPTHMKDWGALSLERIYSLRPLLRCHLSELLLEHSILTELSERMHPETTLNRSVLELAEDTAKNLKLVFEE